MDSKWSGAPGSTASFPGRIVDNAFCVLGLTPRAKWPEVDRRARALLESLDAAGSATYDTPLGPRPLTEGAIRVARAQLRDPDVRIQHEIWWETPTRGPAPASPPHCSERDTWPHADAAWGWRPR